jgi:predicted RND superfamily exporter protein
MRRFSRRFLARFGRRRYPLLFIATAAVAVVSLFLASRLRFDTDVLGLLPREEPIVTDFREALTDFGSLDYLLVAVRIPDDAVLPPYEEYVDILGKRLVALGAFEEVQYRLGQLEELLAEFLPTSLVFLDLERLETLAERVTDSALRSRAAELKRLVGTPKSLIAKDLIRNDPLGLAQLFLDQVRSSRGTLALDWKSTYLISRDRGMLLLLAKPRRPPQDVRFARELVAAVQAEIATAGDEWREQLGREGFPAPEVALGGRHVIAIGDASIIQRDVILNILTSMIGVLVLFLLAFRRLGPLLYAFVPLTCGLILTFGFSSLAYGVLSAATSGVAALLIGLGIDFVIVSYGRFVEERQRGRSLEEALHWMSGSSGRAVVVGGVTSAATFYAFGVTDFTGLNQMGYLTGSGILFCMLAVLLLLPAMLSWTEDHHRRRRSIPRHFLHGFGSGRLIPLCTGHPRLILLGSVALTVAAAIAATGLRFEDSIEAMRPRGNPGVEVRDEIAERYGVGFDQMMLVVEGERLEKVLRLADRATIEADKLVVSGVLRGVDSITSLVPPLEDQERVLSWLETAREDRLDPERIGSTFKKALAEEGLRSEPFAGGLELFQRAVARKELLTVAEVQATPHGSQFLERYLRRTAAGWKSVVYLFPPPKTWRRQAPPEAVSLAERLGEDVLLTGSNVISSFLRKRVLRDALVAAILGFVVVGFLLWLDYRKLGDTVLSLAPLVMGLLWMLGAMSILGLEMNFMNIFVSTMIIGIGVDYGVHMIHRYREFSSRSPERLQVGLVETGKAITLAALSTIVGFGSLSRSHYPGLSSMGLVAILGAISTCLVAITVLPAFLTWRDRSRTPSRSN